MHVLKVATHDRPISIHTRLAVVCSPGIVLLDIRSNVRKREKGGRGSLFLIRSLVLRIRRKGWKKNERMETGPALYYLRWWSE